MSNFLKLALSFLFIFSLWSCGKDSTESGDTKEDTSGINTEFSEIVESPVETGEELESPSSDWQYKVVKTFKKISKNWAAESESKEEDSQEDSQEDLLYDVSP